jgi:hypothetical protein
MKIEEEGEKSLSILDNLIQGSFLDIVEGVILTRVTR